MTELETLKLIKSQILARIVEVSAQSKPSYSVDGQSFSWESYLSMLNSQVSVINGLINAAEPFEFESEGSTEGW